MILISSDAKENCSSHDSASGAPAQPETRNAQIWVWFGALALTIAAGVSIIVIQLRYMKHYPFFFDPVSYQYHLALSYANVVDHGRLSEFFNECLSNGVFPLRSLPLILLAPDLLANPLGHLATSLPILLIFLALLGLTMLRLSRSLLYAQACMVAFCGLPGLYHPQQGLGAFWLDSTSSLLLGCCALSLINYLVDRKNSWLAVFSAFVAMTCFSRYVAGAYVAVTCYPVIAVALTLVGRRSGIKAVIRPLLLVTLLPALLCGPFLVFFAPAIYRYYTVFGYALHQPIALSAQMLFDFTLSLLVTPPYGILLLSLGACNFLIRRQRRNQNAAILFAALWMPTAFLVFFICVLRSAQSGYIMWYALPLLFTLFSLPQDTNLSLELSTKGGGANGGASTMRKAIATVLLVLGFTSAAFAVRSNYHIARIPPVYPKRLKQLDLSLAKMIESEGSRTPSWYAFFDEYITMPNLEYFYKHKALPQISQKLFTSHATYWHGFYPRKTTDEIFDIVLARTAKEIALAVVLHDSDRASSLFDNPISSTIAKRMSRALAGDPHWRKISTIDAVRYGKLDVYQNQDLIKTAK